MRSLGPSKGRDDSAVEAHMQIIKNTQSSAACQRGHTILLAQIRIVMAGMEAGSSLMGLNTVAGFKMGTCSKRL